MQNANSAAGSDKVNMEWVDTDGCISAPQYCKYFISSVTKGIQAAVKNAVLSAANGTFKGGNYIGDLANDGVVLSPLPRLRQQDPGVAAVPAIATIKQEIISGKIKSATKSPV